MKKFVTRSCSILAVSISLAFILLAAKSDKITLQYNLLKDSIYKINTVADQVIEQTMMGQTQTIKNHIEGLMVFKVQNIEGNIILLESWYEKLKMVMDLPTGKQEMDSEHPDNGNPASAMLGKMINKHFTMKMTTKGEITEVNSDKLLEDMVAGVDEQQAAISKEMMKQYVGKDALKGSMEMMTRCFPENEVSVGDSWTNKSELTSIMSADVIMNWKLTESKGGVSSMVGSGTLKSKEINPFTKMNGYPMKFDILGDQQIQSKVDEKTGWVIESTTSSEISGKAIVDASAQGGGTMEIPMKIISKTVVTGIK